VASHSAEPAYSFELTMRELSTNPGRSAQFRVHKRSIARSSFELTDEGGGARAFDRRLEFCNPPVKAP
jgi:hypothetical protein